LAVLKCAEDDDKEKVSLFLLGTRGDAKGHCVMTDGFKVQQTDEEFTVAEEKEPPEKER
jgi:transcription antitermination factor NusA-like protein